LFSVPSIKKLFDRPRAPLTEKVPTPKPPRLLDTPGNVKAKATGFKPLIGNSVICRGEILPPRTEDSVCNCPPASAVTSTLTS
jgi:hypothetical protein